MSYRRLFISPFIILLTALTIQIAGAQQTPPHVVDAAVAAANNEVPGLGRPSSWQHSVLQPTNISSLGCEIAVGEQMNVTVIPFRVTLQYPNANYVVHVSDDGNRVQICDTQFPTQGSGVSGGGQPPGVDSGVEIIPPSVIIAASPCPSGFGGYMTPRIRIGSATAQVSQGGAPNRLRAEPNVSAPIITQAQPGRRFDQVLAGPACSDTYVWWQVEIDGSVGWTVESDAASSSYFLEPVPGFEAAPPPGAVSNFIAGSGPVIANNNVINIQRGQSHPAQFVRYLAWSPDGTRIAFMGNVDGRDGVVLLQAPSLERDPMQDAINSAMTAGEQSLASKLAFSPDGNLLAIGGGDGSLRLANLTSGQITTLTNRHDQTVLTLTFSPDGSTLLSADGFFECHPDGCAGGESTLLMTNISSMDVTTGAAPLLVNLHFPDTIFEIEFSADGQHLAVAGLTAIWSYDAATNELVFATAIHNDGSVPFLTPVPSIWPDGSIMFIYYDAGNAAYFNPVTQLADGFMSDQNGEIRDIIFNPVAAPGTNVVLYANLVQTGLDTNALSFFSPQDFGPLLRLPVAGLVRDAAFSPDGRLLAVLTDAGLDLWGVP